MITVRLGLLAVAAASIALGHAAHARQGGAPGGYYVTSCKTTEGTSQQKTVCTVFKGCQTVYLPVKKTTTCTKKWVDPHAS